MRVTIFANFRLKVRSQRFSTHKKNPFCSIELQYSFVSDTTVLEHSAGVSVPSSGIYPADLCLTRLGGVYV